MRALTHHLLAEHGMRELWFFGTDPGSTDGRPRFEGFRSALCHEHLPAPDHPRFHADGTRTDAHAVAAKVLPGAQLPEAIVCASDQIALGVIDVLAREGVRVPQQVAVTGFDGIDAGRFQRPGLTTVRQPMDALGRVAVNLLADRIEHAPSDPTHHQLPVTVVLRESCGCLPR